MRTRHRGHVFIVGDEDDATDESAVAAPLALAGELTQACIIMPGEARQVSRCRTWLARLLAGHPVADDAVLALGELAANAVIHSESGRPGGVFGVRALLACGVIRVEVTDAGGEWHTRGQADDEGGRGLTIVAGLATRWGVIRPDDSSRTCRTVWCEFEMPGQEAGGME